MKTYFLQLIQRNWPYLLTMVFLGACLTTASLAFQTMSPITSNRTEIILSDDFTGAEADATGRSPKTGKGNWTGNAKLSGKGTLISDDMESGSRILSFDLSHIDWSDVVRIQVTAKMIQPDVERGWFAFGFNPEPTDLREEGAPLVRQESNRRTMQFVGPGETDRIGALKIPGERSEIFWDIDTRLFAGELHVDGERFSSGPHLPKIPNNYNHFIMQFQASQAEVDSIEIKVIRDDGKTAKAAPAPSVMEMTHGPKLGRATPDSMRVWIRTNKEGSFSVRYGESADPKKMTSKVDGRTVAANDNSGFVDLQGLKPGTKYFYAIEVDGKLVKKYVGTDSLPFFHTLPDADTFRHKELNPDGKFNLKFGMVVGNHIGGAKTTNAYQHLWDANLDHMIYNGDYIYEYFRRRIRPYMFQIEDFWSDYKGYWEEIPGMGKLMTRVPGVWVVDDHEIGPEEATAEIGYRVTAHKRNHFTQPVLRDWGYRAWYDYVGWANYDMPHFQDLRFGTATVKQGSDLLVDPNAKFTTLDKIRTGTLHAHINERNGGVFGIKEVVNDTTLRIEPPAHYDEEDMSYSIGTMHHFDYKIGNSHFFVLDTRGNRTEYSPKKWESPEQRLLGDPQLEWLLNGVKNSDSEFIFIISSVPWFVYHNASHTTKPPRVINIRESDKEDGFGGHLWERARCMEVFRALDKPVIILTGDLHSAFAIQADDNVWEFMISPVTSSLHPVESGGNPPFGGWYKPGDEIVKIKWASTMPMAHMPNYRKLDREDQGYVFGVITVKNTFPVGKTDDGEVYHMAYDTPTVIVEFRQSETNELLYAEAITPLDAKPRPDPKDLPEN